MPNSALPATGIPIFGLDALGSAAYGPEAALTILIPLGAAGIAYALPISVAVIILLAIVFFSYLQTIAAYPTGGGSYTVARKNLGSRVGLLAGTALMIHYILNVAMGISTGVGALVSAVSPTRSGCLGLLLILTAINLRGVREAGIIFIAPTYIFVACLLGVIVMGVFNAISSGASNSRDLSSASPDCAASCKHWLLIKAFASRTLTVIIAILMLMLAGIGYLVRVYNIAATEPGKPGYESLLSQVTAAVAGKGVFYFVTIGSILVVPALSANTSFADFPGFAERWRKMATFRTGSPSAAGAWCIPSAFMCWRFCPRGC